MSLSNYLENELLDHIAGSSYTVPSSLNVKLHTGDPGEDCTGNAAAETTRKAVTFGTASAGSMSATGSPVAEWTAVSNTETYTHFSVWDNISAGNPLGYGALSGSAAMTAGDTFRLTALTWTLN
jgi:hypothetical protein